MFLEKDCNDAIEFALHRMIVRFRALGNDRKTKRAASDGFTLRACMPGHRSKHKFTDYHRVFSRSKGIRAFVLNIIENNDYKALLEYQNHFSLEALHLI